MRKLLIVLIVLIGSVGWVTAQDDATATPEGEHELETVLNFGADIFEPSVWRIGFAEEAEQDTHAAYYNRQQSDTLFFFAYLHFDQGMTEQVINDYLVGATFDNLLANYTPFSLLQNCRVGDIRLYEFRSLRDDAKKVLRYWFVPITPTRLLVVSGVARVANLEVISLYARQLFPEIPSCTAIE